MSQHYFADPASAALAFVAEWQPRVIGGPIRVRRQATDGDVWTSLIVYEGTSGEVMGIHATCVHDESRGWRFHGAMGGELRTSSDAPLDFVYYVEAGSRCFSVVGAVLGPLAHAAACAHVVHAGGKVLSGDVENGAVAIVSAVPHVSPFDLELLGGSGEVLWREHCAMSETEPPR